MLKLLLILIIITKTFALDLEPYMTTSRLLYIPKKNCYSLEEDPPFVYYLCSVFAECDPEPALEEPTFVCYLYEDELKDICGYKPPWDNYTLSFKYPTPFEEVEDWIVYREMKLKNTLCNWDNNLKEN